MENVNIILPSVCYSVEKIVGISVGQENLKCFKVQWAPSWVTEVNLVGCEKLVAQYYEDQERLRRNKEKERGRERERNFERNERCYSRSIDRTIDRNVDRNDRSSDRNRTIDRTIERNYDRSMGRSTDRNLERDIERITDRNIEQDNDRNTTGKEIDKTPSQPPAQAALSIKVEDNDLTATNQDISTTHDSNAETYLSDNVQPVILSTVSMLDGEQVNSQIEPDHYTEENHSISTNQELAYDRSSTNDHHQSNAQTYDIDIDISEASMVASGSATTKKEYKTNNMNYSNHTISNPNDDYTSMAGNRNMMGSNSQGSLHDQLAMARKNEELQKKIAELEEENEKLKTTRAKRRDPEDYLKQKQAGSNDFLRLIKETIKKEKLYDEENKHSKTREVCSRNIWHSLGFSDDEITQDMLRETKKRITTHITTDRYRKKQKQEKEQNFLHDHLCQTR